MSKSIPPVRLWRVRYWQGKALLKTCYVSTINKRFARNLARCEQGGWRAWQVADRESVSAVKA